MVAQTVHQSTVAFSGLRPLNPGRDLTAVALLLEEAFREDLSMLHLWSRVPVLREVGAALWSTAFLPMPSDMLRGFVWEEQGRIVGNVTLTLDDRRTQRWLISNVAVAEKYRRRGIAKQMMRAAIDETEAHSGRYLALNVRPHNIAAVELYRALGFATVDTEMNYIRTKPRALQVTPLPIRRLEGAELRSAWELARSGMPEILKFSRALDIGDFGVQIEDRAAERVLDLFVLQSTERWGYFENGELKASLTLKGQRVGAPHSMDIRVAPAARGTLEAGLVAAALRRLGEFPRREIATRLFTSHSALVEALGNAGFVPTRGLTLMVKELRP